MTLLQAAITFTLAFMHKSGIVFDEPRAILVAESVVALTSDPSEIETMIKIARWESDGFRTDIFNCQKKGDHGQAHGLWQVHPRNQKEAKELCASVPEQATIALSRVRESYAYCKKFGMYGSDLLTAYTHGQCVKNTAIARMRWGNGKTIRKILEGIE